VTDNRNGENEQDNLPIQKTYDRQIVQRNNCLKKMIVDDVGRISVTLPDELEKKLRFKTITEFGGRKGDLTKAVEGAVRTWVVEKD
jgi:hypothetical protein